MSHNHVFTILFDVPDADAHELLAARAYDDDGLQDLLLGGPDERGILEADFDREAACFQAAVLSAITDLQRVFPEARLLRVDPDDLVTLSGIAHRVGRTHESIRLFAAGRRGPGGFPPCAGRLEGRTQVWRWHDVVQWFEQSLGADVPEGANAAFLAALNDVLDLRRIAARAVDSELTARGMAALLPPQLLAAVAEG